MTWLLIILLLCFSIRDGQAENEDEDPCQVFQPIPDAPARAINNSINQALNDRYILERWYGLHDIIIPTAIPTTDHCGTYYPIYLTASANMNINTIQTLTACVRGFVVCEIEVQIKAKVCSSNLVVYYLNRAPSSGSAYCVGSLTGDPIPEFPTTPTVNVTTEEDGYLRFRFFCEFTSPNTDIYYRADWYIDNRFIYRSPQVAYTEHFERSLTETQINDLGIKSAGFDISCQIRASFHANSSVGLPSMSKPVFIGIRVLTPVITVAEGKTGQINIKPSVEIGCSRNKCGYNIAVNIPEPENTCAPTIRAQTRCGVIVDAYNRGWDTEYSLQITGIITETYQKTAVKMKVTLISEQSYVDHLIWSNYTLQPVTVHVTKDTTKIENIYCTSSTDPYISTFDGRYTVLQMAGTFTMYSNVEEKVEVQFKTALCKEDRIPFGGAYCNCGVVVRSGRTVYMINRCGLEYWNIDYIVVGDGCDIMDIKRNGGTYNILLHTGTRVDVHILGGDRIPHLNIYIYPSVLDFMSTEGLCGNFNQIYSDDFTLRDGTNNSDADKYIDSWKAELTSNLFNVTVLNKLEGRKGKYTTCACNETPSGDNHEVHCSTSPAVTCVEDDNSYTKVNQKKCVSPSRKRRFVPTFVEDTYHSRGKRDVSWKQGWTADSATVYCQKVISDSKMAKLCEQVPGVDFEGPMMQCISDIQASGTDIFALSALDVIQSKCNREAKMNTSLHEETPEKKSILQQVKEVSCPGECSNNGICNNGRCTCNAEFIGHSCSVDIHKPPLADSLEAGGYCDLDEESCTETAVFGGTFVESDSTMCKIVPFEYRSSGMTTKASKIVIAVVESVGEITCPLPGPAVRQKRSVQVPSIDETVTGYRVSVTNNGAKYSQELTMVIINSKCISCNIEGQTVQCTFDKHYCIFNNRCYRDGETYPYNRFYRCQTQTGLKTWINTNHEEPKGGDHGEPKSVVWAIIGGIICGLVLIAVSIAIFCLIRRRRKVETYDTPNQSTQDLHVYSTG